MIGKPLLLVVEWPKGDKARTPVITHARLMNWFERIYYTLHKCIGLAKSDEPHNTSLPERLGIEAARPVYAMITGMLPPQGRIVLSVIPEDAPFDNGDEEMEIRL